MIKSSNKVVKLAFLEGAEMLSFRNGADLYPYCKDCLHSEIIPVATEPLGCTIGDDPEVKAFSDEDKEQPKDPSVEKCPGFQGLAGATEGVGDMQSIESMLTTADVAEAGMIKELPAEMRPHTEEDWKGMLEEALEDLRSNNPKEVGRIQFAQDMLEKHDHKSQQDPEQEYDHFGELEEHPSGNITHPKKSVNLQFKQRR